MMTEIKITPELKKLAEEYREECPYLNNLGELLKKAAEEHKAALEYLKDK